MSWGVICGSGKGKLWVDMIKTHCIWNCQRVDKINYFQKWFQFMLGEHFPLLLLGLGHLVYVSTDWKGGHVSLSTNIFKKKETNLPFPVPVHSSLSQLPFTETKCWRQLVYKEQWFVLDHPLFSITWILCFRPLMWVPHGSGGGCVWHSLDISLCDFLGLPSLGDVWSSYRQAFYLSSHGFHDHSCYTFNLGNPLVNSVVNLTGSVIN